MRPETEELLRTGAPGTVVPMTKEELEEYAALQVADDCEDETCGCSCHGRREKSGNGVSFFFLLLLIPLAWTFYEGALKVFSHKEAQEGRELPKKVTEETLTMDQDGKWVTK